MPSAGAQVDAALRNYSGPVDCARRMLKEEGLKSFYKGLSAGYLGVAETAVQFVLYEHIKEQLTIRRQAELVPPAEGHATSTMTATSFDVLLASGFAKFSACLIAYPHELIRTRLREQKNVIGEHALERAVPYKRLVHCAARRLPRILLRTGSSFAAGCAQYCHYVYCVRVPFAAAILSGSSFLRCRVRFGIDIAIFRLFCFLNFLNLSTALTAWQCSDNPNVFCKYTCAYESSRAATIVVHRTFPRSPFSAIAHQGAASSRLSSDENSVDKAP